jgi:hypothetical protein
MLYASRARWCRWEYNLSASLTVRSAAILSAVLVTSAARAADEDPVCHFLLQQIGAAAQRASRADDDVHMRAQYLQRIALMERSALQGPYPSAAGVFDSELARAEQSLDAAKARSEAADAAINAATTAYVEQCPQHFMAMQGNYLTLTILAVKSLTDP